MRPADPTTPADPAALWTEFSAPLRTFVRRRVPPDEDADDVVQDVFLRIVRHQSQLTNVVDLEAWIYRVTRTALSDALRGAQRRRARASNVDPALVVAGESDDEHDDEQGLRELVPCLMPFLRRLDEPYRRSLEMTALEGLTLAEAAAIERISLSGMKSRVQRARERLRREFVACCVLHGDPASPEVSNGMSRCRPQEDVMNEPTGGCCGGAGGGCC